VGAVRAALADAGEVDILGVGLDGQMHGLVLSDSLGAPVRPALLWADQRAGDQLPRWQELSAAARRAH